MTAIYRLPADQIQETLLRSIQSAFGSQEIEIIVRNIDDTDHLLSTQANREHLAQAIRNLDDPKRKVTLSLDELS